MNMGPLAGHSLAATVRPVALPRPIPLPAGDSDDLALGDHADADEARARWQGEAARAAASGRSEGTSARRRRLSLDAFAVPLILALAALGGVARYATADWGLPYALHVDEKGFVVHDALQIEHDALTRGVLRPRSTAYGPMVFGTVIAVKWSLFGGPDEARRVAREYDDAWTYVNQAATLQRTERTFSFPELLLALRRLSALLGGVAILLLGLAALRLEGARVGVLAAGLTAASVGLIQVGHFFTAESLLIPELALLFWGAARFGTSAPRSSSRRAGAGAMVLAGGLLLLTKLPGALVLAIVPVAVAESRRVARPRVRLGQTFGEIARAMFSRSTLGVALGAFALAAILHPLVWGRFGLAGMELQASVEANRAGFVLVREQFVRRTFDFYDWRFVYMGGIPFWTQLSSLAPYALGGLTALAAYAGLLRGLIPGRRRFLDQLAWAGALPTLLFVGGFAVGTIRYLLPALPALILAASSFVASPLGEPSPGAAQWRRRVGVALTLACVLSVTAWTGLRAVAYVAMFRELDPRVLAGRYLAAHAAPGDTVALDLEGSYSAVLNERYDLLGRVEPEFPSNHAGVWADRAVPPPPDPPDPPHLRSAAPWPGARATPRRYRTSRALRRRG